MWKQFGYSYIFTAIGLVLGYMLGGPSAVWICLLLGILEVSLSFDNAVINAKELNKMSPIWQKRFLTWGMLIAVFGMRIVFPVLIVSIVGDMSIYTAIMTAIYDPTRYESIISSSHQVLGAFGGVFLGMVFLRYFLDKHKDHHWIGYIEHFLSKLGKLESIEIIIVLSIITYIAYTANSLAILISGIVGLIIYLSIHSLTYILAYLEKKSSTAVNTINFIKGGLGTFLYLEVLDASFSFDGVIGAFAITRNIFLIAIGLGIGAMFVRSLTLILVQQNTLQKFAYLEHGAYRAIGFLASVMLANAMSIHIPESVTGIVSGLLIIISIIHSYLSDKQASEQ